MNSCINTKHGYILAIFLLGFNLNKGQTCRDRSYPYVQLCVNTCSGSATRIVPSGEKLWSQIGDIREERGGEEQRERDSRVEGKE